MSGIEWGEPIAVDGKRPEWFQDCDAEKTAAICFDGEEQIPGDDDDLPISEWIWADLQSIRLPKDHWAYLTDRDDRRVELAQLSDYDRELMARIWNRDDGMEPLRQHEISAANPYHHLSTVLDEALAQASEGKGRERHAQDLPFHEQPMQQLIDLYGMGFALGQAGKKMQESQRLPYDAARNELLGAIVYIAGAIVAMDRGRDETSENGE